MQELIVLTAVKTTTTATTTRTKYNENEQYKWQESPNSNSIQLYSYTTCPLLCPVAICLIAINAMNKTRTRDLREID